MNLNTKTYLSQMWNIDRRIKDKLNEAEKWKNIAFSRSYRGAGEITPDKVKSSHSTQDKMADAIAASVDYYNEAVAISKEMVEKKHTIEIQIDSIQDDGSYNILHAYYIDDKTLKEISEDECYSYRSTQRRFEKALKHFESIYGSTYLDVEYKVVI